MNKVKKATKLITRLEDLVSKLTIRKEVIVHEKVNQFYYLEKIEELKILAEKFEEVHRRLEAISDRLEECYGISFRQWNHDVRWLHGYLLNKQRGRPIL
jgi:hypothetical protein